MATQISSRTRVSRPASTPNAPDIANPPTARANPPSRVPISMGMKKNKLAKSEVNAWIRIQSQKETLSVRIMKINQISRQPTIRAANSRNRER